MLTYLQEGDSMPKRQKVDAKTAELDRSGTLNPHPEVIVDPLFQNNPFFDARDLLQTRYEMLRRHRIEGRSIVEATLAFGVSRPTFYHAQTAFTEQGLAGLLPQLRGPKSRHKLSGEVVQHILTLKTADPTLTTAQCVREIQQHFGISVHRRSLERALQTKKKQHEPTRQKRSASMYTASG
jgi:transposase